MAKIEFDDVALDFSEEVAPDFSEYFLLRNPFPRIPVAQDHPDIFVNRESIMRRIEYVIKDGLETGRSNLAVVIGDYGAGKSHILKYLKARINETMPKRREARGIAAYVTPGRSIRDLYANFLRDLGLEFFVSILRSMPKPHLVFQAHSQDIFGQEGRYLSLETLPDAVRRNVSQDLQRAFLNLYTPELRTPSWQWIVGMPLLAAERRAIGVRTSLKDMEVLTAFKDVIVLLNSFGFRLVCVLLDELESIVDIAPRDREPYYNDLRHFIDQNTTGICLIMTITRKAWIDFRDHGHPLERRLIRNMDELWKFTNEDATELIRRHLLKGRDEYAMQTGSDLNTVLNRIMERYPEHDPTIFPFTSDAITTINAGELADGKVSEILRIASDLIDRGYMNQVVYNEETVLQSYSS
jgi:hypothetical protein